MICEIRKGYIIMNKRLICLLMSMIVCMISSVPGVYAGSNNTENTVNLEKTLDFLRLVGIGDDYDTETTQYSDKVTKSVFADYVAKILGEDASDFDNVYYHDVPRDYWAAGAIGILTQKGILHGSGENKFYPDKEITRNEAIKIIVSALNYGYVAEADGGFPAGYINIASRLKLLDGVGASEYLTLYDMLKLLENALCIEELVIDGISGDNAEYRPNDKTLLNRVFNLYEEKGKMTACDEINATGDPFHEPDTAIIDNVKYLYDMINVIDYLGENIDFVYHYDEDTDVKKVVAMWKRDRENTRAITVDRNATFDKANFVLSYTNSTGKRQKVSISKGVVVFFNGEFVGSDVAEYFNKSCYDLKLFKRDETGDYDTALIWEYDNYSVSSIDSYNQVVYDKIDKTRTLNLEQNNYDKIDILDENGNKKSFEDITADNILCVYKSESGKRMQICISKKMISGTVSKTSSEENEITLTINDTEYGCVSNHSTRNVKIGNSVTAYLDVKGKIAYIDSQNKNYFPAYIIRAYEDEYENVQIKIINSDGEFVTLSCGSKVRIDGKTWKQGDILNALTEEGQTKQQLALFRVDSNEVVKQIDTAYVDYADETESKSLVNYVELASSSLFKKNGSVGKLGYKIMLDADTIIFSVPNSFSTREEDFDVKSFSELRIDDTYNAAAYKVEGDDAEYADIIVVKGKEWYISKSNEADILVKEISVALNSVGDAAEKLEGYSGSSPVSLTTDGEYSLISQGIKPGDILHVTKNKAGDIKGATVAFKYGGSSRPKNLSINAGYRQIMGYANKKVGQNIQIGYDSAESFDEVFNLSDIPVLIYAPSGKEKIRVGSINDIKTYDVYGSNCSDVYIQAYSATIKLVVAYQEW